MGPHGIHMSIATDDDMDGWFEVEDGVDYAQAAIDTWRAGKKNPEPGLYPILIDTRRPVRPDPS